MLFCKLKLHKALSVILFTILLQPSINKCVAQCNGKIGVLKVLNAQHQDGIFICYNDTLQVELDSYELMDSQKLYYLYHNKADVFSSWFKVDTLKTNGFVNLRNPPKKLYVTAIVSKGNWLEDSCAIFSNTIEFNCLNELKVYLDINPVSRKEYNIKVQAMGGMPEFDNRYKYFVTGNINDVLRINEIARFNVELKSRETFNLFIIDANGCTTDSYSKILESLFQFPITLIAFDGQVEGTNHLLKWITATEINSNFFVLEVSKNGNDFEVLDSIKGGGTTSQTNKYSFINENVTPGTYQYQLSQVDLDGAIELIGRLELKSYALQAFPNPTNNNLSFHFSGAHFNNLTLQIFDSAGKKVLNFDEVKSRYNRNGLTINISSLAEGTYFAQIWADNFKRVEKFIVEK